MMWFITPFLHKKNKKILVGFGDFSQQHGLVKKHPIAPIQF
jgi:hypothetical protein